MTLMLPRMARASSDAKRWMERNLYLPQKYGAGTGWHLYRWQCGIIDAMQSPYVRRVAAKIGTQAGKTTIANGFILWTMDCKPGPVLLVYPTEKVARKILHNKLVPQITNCIPLQERVEAIRVASRKRTGPDKTMVNNSENIDLGMGGYIAIGHSHAPATLVGETCILVVGDEIDKFADPITNLGDMESRLTVAGADGKLVLISSPDKAGGSPIDGEFEMGSRRYFLVPCVHCLAQNDERLQLLLWDNVRLEWDPRIKAYTGTLWCPNCGTQITDSDRAEMLEHPLAEWLKQVNTSDGPVWESGPWEGYETFTVSRLYMPTIPLNEICAKWRDGVAYEAKFYADVLAISYDYSVNPEMFVVDWDRRVTGVLPYTSPLQAITAGVDLQEDRLEYSVYGWYNDPAQPNVEAMVYTHRTIPFTKEGTDGVAPACDRLFDELAIYRPDNTFFDIGHWPDSIRQAILSNPKLRDMHGNKRLFPCIGMAQRTGRTFGKPLAQSPTRIAGMVTYRIPTDEAGLQLWSLIHQEDYHVFEGGVDRETFINQLEAEVLEHDEKGALRWRQRRDRNEVLDCGRMALAAYHNLDVGYKRPELSITYQGGQQVSNPVPAEGNFAPGLELPDPEVVKVEDMAEAVGEAVGNLQAALELVGRK